jgi:glycosyltransferase involved in cell wall biosynthesis
MRRVLHVGPANSPGGMATVMRILEENPPEGWKAQTIATHVDGSILAKLVVWRRARRQIEKLLQDDSKSRPDLVHIHSAADWSFRRKAVVMLLCKKSNVPCVLHIHSGKFDDWLGKPSNSAAVKARKVITESGAKVVVLTEKWAERLTPLLGDCQVIFNPIEAFEHTASSTPSPISSPTNAPRDAGKLLLMGRPDPVKGASLAIAAARIMRNQGREVTLHLTGVAPGHKWSRLAEAEGLVVAHGWLPIEELEQLRAEAGLMLVPSEWEGQPMVILEAMARGLPILGSPACAEHIGGAGRIVAEMSPEAWAQAIGTLLDDEGGRREMSEAGKERAKLHLIEVVAKQWKTLYNDLAD